MSFLRLYKEIIRSIGLERIRKSALTIQARFNAEKEAIKSRLTKDELMERGGEDQRRLNVSFKPSTTSTAQC